jgi:transcription antitermination factor NusG
MTPADLSLSLSTPVITDIARWYALYTYPRHERAVTENLEHQSIEAFLPSCLVKSQWKDRQVQISRAIFPCYVFARIGMNQKVKVMSIPSVIRIVAFNGAPAPIPDSEIEAVRLCLSNGARVERHSFLEVGERVRVRCGVFEGLEGIVLRHSNGCKLVVSIGLIHQAVALEIEASQLEPIEGRTPMLIPPTPGTFSQHLQ